MPSIVGSAIKESTANLQTTIPIFISVLVIGLLCKAAYNVFTHPLRKFPGPTLWAISPLPYIRMALSGRHHQTQAELHKKYGDIVRVSPNELSFACPEAWESVMGHRKRGEQENGKEGSTFRLQKFSVISADRTNHARMRRVLSHGFSAQSMLDQQPLITHYVDLLIKRLHENCVNGTKALDMTAWYNYTTFDVIGDLVFGESFGCLESSDYHPWVTLIFDRIKFTSYNAYLGRLPFGSFLLQYFMSKSARERSKGHIKLTIEKVAKRRAMPEPRPDFMQSMLRTDEKMKMSDLEIRDNSSLLIIAGSETTATALSGATYLLSSRPETLAKLQEEVRTSFKSEEEITLISVQKLKYMLAVLDETLRLYPPVPNAIARKTPQTGSTICGEYIPPETNLSISQWTMNRNPKNFALPDKFMPERWLDDPRFANDAKEAMQPFSFGPRNCIGRNLAYAEMRLILAKVVWNFDFKIAEESKNWIEKNDSYVLWAKPKLHAYLTPRQMS